jgi:serine protease Do
MLRNRESQPAGLLGVIVLAFLCSAHVRPPAALASSLRRSPIVEAIAKAQPSVVNIQGRKVIRADPEPGNADPFRQVNGMGTGIIIDRRGYILTNYHVVENVEVIQVTLADKRGFVGNLVSHDPLSDLAVIKIDADNPLPVIPTGISSDLMLGETVIAVGNAFGYENTVTDGIISALHREVQVSATQKYHDLIQTDASINPGNSGGPLLNVDGEMIGINVAVRVGAVGIGFAIPVDEVLEIAARLLSVERIDHVVHGVVGETQSVGSERKFVVKSIREGSAAEKCGLKTGDVVATIDQAPIRRAIDLERALLGRDTGKPVVLSIQRDGQTQTVELVLAPSSLLADEFDRRTWDVLGLKLSPASREECQRLQTRYRGGMRVVAVRPDGAAARQGMRPGDILVGMHIWEMVSRDNVQYILNHDDFEQLQPIKFFILRGTETLYGHMPLKRGPVVQVSRRPERE